MKKEGKDDQLLQKVALPDNGPANESARNLFYSGGVGISGFVWSLDKRAVELYSAVYHLGLCLSRVIHVRPGRAKFFWQEEGKVRGGRAVDQCVGRPPSFVNYFDRNSVEINNERELALNNLWMLSRARLTNVFPRR